MPLLNIYFKVKSFVVDYIGNAKTAYLDEKKITSFSPYVVKRCSRLLQLQENFKCETNLYLQIISELKFGLPALISCGSGAPTAHAQPPRVQSSLADYNVAPEDFSATAPLSVMVDM